MKISSILVENYDAYKDSKWVHYSNHEMLMIHPSKAHGDPTGIYFFPENDSPKYTIWHKMTYKFIVTLKPDTRVLDLPRIGDTELAKFVEATGITEKLQASLERHPPENRREYVDRAWEYMRINPLGYGLGAGSAWNKIVRDMGYDAVFDDAGIIHIAEPIQLLVLNPRCITLLARERQKRDIFRKIGEVVNQLKAMCEPYGIVTVEGPRRMTDYWSRTKALQALLNVKNGERHADFVIKVHPSPDYSHIIDIHLRYSSPRLDYGVGAQFDAAKNEWESYGGIDRLKRDLDRIFAVEA